MTLDGVIAELREWLLDEQDAHRASVLEEAVVQLLELKNLVDNDVVTTSSCIKEVYSWQRIS